MKQLNLTSFIFKFYLIIFSFLVISDEVKAQPQIKNSEESKSTFPNSQQDKIAQCWYMGYITISLMKQLGFEMRPMIDSQGRPDPMGVLLQRANISQQLAKDLLPANWLDQKRFKYITGNFHRYYLNLPVENLHRYSNDFEAFFKTWEPMLGECSDFMFNINNEKKLKK